MNADRNPMRIEMHCHTLFSVDGHCTPETVGDVAAERGITTLSIAEHNNMGSLQRAQKHAGEKGIGYISGVEFDGIWEAKNFHFLAYGFDAHNEALISFAERNFGCAERNFSRYLEILERDYGVKRETLIAGLAKRYPTHPSPVLSLAYANHAMVAGGIFPDIAAAIKMETVINRKVLERWGAEAVEPYATFEVIRDVVHNAGGIVLLAHVALGNKGNLEKQLPLIRDLTEKGLDGFELYSPFNLSEPHFDELVAESKRLGCAVSGGSDCHNAAEKGSSFGTVAVPDYVVATIETALARVKQNEENRYVSSTKKQ